MAADSETSTSTPTSTATGTTSSATATSVTELLEGRVVLDVSGPVDFAELEAPLKTWLSRLLQVSPEQISVPGPRSLARSKA